MERRKVDAIILIVCSLVLFILGVRNFVIGDKFDCNECKVELVNQIANGEEYLFGVFSIQELFEGYYLNGTCEVTWSPTGGYSYG